VEKKKMDMRTKSGMWDAPDLCGPPILKKSQKRRGDTHGIINLLSTSSIKNISQRALYYWYL